MTRLTQQLEAMRRLPENWDGVGAAAPDKGAVDLAHDFVSFLEVALRKARDTFAGLHVSPTHLGGVLIQWEDPVLAHEVEINPDQSISFLHQEKATGQIATRRFTPGILTVIDPGLLRELRQLFVD